MHRQGKSEASFSWCPPLQNPMFLPQPQQVVNAAPPRYDGSLRLGAWSKFSAEAINQPKGGGEVDVRASAQEMERTTAQQYEHRSPVVLARCEPCQRS